MRLVSEGGLSAQRRFQVPAETLTRHACGWPTMRWRKALQYDHICQECRLNGNIGLTFIKSCSLEVGSTMHRLKCLVC
jgi:hypothetical protein